MTPLPIPIIDLFIASMKGAVHLAPYYNLDYQLRWEEIGEAVFETSWDFIEGRHERTVLAWTGISEIVESFESFLNFIRTNKLW
jgi:hypothetical protein